MAAERSSKTLISLRVFNVWRKVGFPVIFVRVGFTNSFQCFVVILLKTDAIFGSNPLFRASFMFLGRRGSIFGPFERGIKVFTHLFYQ